MSVSRKWLYVSALSIGGVLCAVLSFLGGFGLLWGGFLRVHDPLLLLFFLPLLVSFPLFLLSLGLTRLANLAMWVLIPVHWGTIVHISMSSFSGGLAEYVKLMCSCLVQKSVIGLFLAAGLVLCGIQAFPGFSMDDFFLRKLGVKI